MVVKYLKCYAFRFSMGFLIVQLSVDTIFDRCSWVFIDANTKHKSLMAFRPLHPATRSEVKSSDPLPTQDWGGLEIEWMYRKT